MTLRRYRLIPAGTWVTPWQADTLLGMLACVYGRVHGSGKLEEHFLGPWRDRRPLFVISDALPGDLLPAPACLSLWDWPEAGRKTVKRTRWLTREGFRDVQAARRPQLPQPPLEPFRSALQMRNTLSRLTDTTGDPGSLFGVGSTALVKDAYLSVYCRAEAQGFDLFEEALGLLAEVGYGADATVGQGQFTFQNPPEDDARMDGVGDADGWISLSTFQPAEEDPCEGFWQSFVKQGKLGPDVGVDNVFKRPQWMLRAGACFRASSGLRGWYGRAIEAEDLLPASTRATLSARDLHPVQPAFALAVPMKWAECYDGSISGRNR